MTTIGYIFYGITLLGLGISIFYNIRFALLILRMQDNIEDSLDVLDERYASISQILQIPLFYDSPEVRQVLQDVEESRNAILYIANNMAKVEMIDSVQQDE